MSVSQEVELDFCFIINSIICCKIVVQMGCLFSFSYLSWSSDLLGGQKENHSILVCLGDLFLLWHMNTKADPFSLMGEMFAPDINKYNLFVQLTHL